jgi:tetratricopeptide (TPR) repeat protein
MSPDVRHCFALPCVVVFSMLGCRQPATTSAPSVEPPPADEAASPAADPHPGEAEAKAADDLPEPWWTPPPPVSLARLSEAEIAAVRLCDEQHGRGSTDSAPAAVLAAARCYGDARAFGRELAMYQRVVEDNRDSEAVAEALRRIGGRAEQLDDRPRALEAHRNYLTRYPKSDDARALGQRGVCLAQSLGDRHTVDALLDQLSMLYARRGFVVPPPAAFPQLCAGLPPIGSMQGG